MDTFREKDFDVYDAELECCFDEKQHRALAKEALALISSTYAEESKKPIAKSDLEKEKSLSRYQSSEFLKYLRELETVIKDRAEERFVLLPSAPGKLHPLLRERYALFQSSSATIPTVGYYRKRLPRYEVPRISEKEDSKAPFERNEPITEPETKSKKGMFGFLKK